jgi:hypothetical protein
MKSLIQGKKSFLAAALAGVVGFGAAQAQAYILLDDWDLNLSLVNGAAISGGGNVAGAVDATGIDEVNISGQSVVNQTVVGGNPVGQPFDDSGILQMTNYTPELFGPVQTFDLGNMAVLFLKFDALTGVLNADGSITFNPGAGTVELWMDTADFDTSSGSVRIAEFDVIAPSGGSDLNFIGGGGQNATIDVTLEVLSTIAPGLFMDKDGKALSTIFVGLVNTDSLLRNTDTSGVDEFGNGKVKLTVSNGGQFNIAVVPEPATLSLFGLGLLGLGYSAKKRRQS